MIWQKSNVLLTFFVMANKPFLLWNVNLHCYPCLQGYLNQPITTSLCLFPHACMHWFLSSKTMLLLSLSKVWSHTLHRERTLWRCSSGVCAYFSNKQLLQQEIYKPGNDDTGNNKSCFYLQEHGKMFYFFNKMNKG